MRWPLGRLLQCSIIMVAVSAARFTSLAAPPAVSGAACGRCGWIPPQTRLTRTVSGAGELEEALREVNPSTTILLEDGEYRLDRMLDIAVSDVVLRGKSGDPARVVIRGAGMMEREVGVAISISAPRVTIADLTVGYVGYHGVQVRGERGASNAMLHNIRVIDTGQQLVKGSLADAPTHADDVVVACSTLEYTSHAPSDYTNAVDVLGGKGWVVRDNRIFRVRGPSGAAGPAILFWGNSQDTVVERNLIVDSFRGIALGLGPGVAQISRDKERAVDHRGGVIRNNIICNLNPWADEGIEANAARDVRIEHNTVLMEGSLPWSISVRFPQTSGWVRNNLTNRRIIFRDGGRASLVGNVETARRDWFVNPAAGDLHLARPGLPPIDAGALLPDVRDDFDGGPRLLGPAPDAGAFEYASEQSRRDERK